MANKKARERELASQLYIYTNATQKEIAERLNISEKTVSQWRVEDKWEELKTTRQSTNVNVINDLRILLSKQLEKNKVKMDEDKFSKADADTLLELARAIETLEGEIPLRTRVQVMEEFMDFIPFDNPKLKKELAEYQMQYLLNKAR